MTRTAAAALSTLLATSFVTARADEELTLTSRGARLAATLRLPATPARPLPAVVTIHGSGRVTAADLLGNAGRRLAELGFAVLAYDKRGIGRSPGEYATITAANSVAMFDLLASDALAAVDALRARPEIDPRRIGLVGFSQGGWIAPLAASTTQVAFIVAVSASAGGAGAREIAYSRLAGEDPGSIAGLSDAEIEDVLSREPTDRGSASRERAPVARCGIWRGTPGAPTHSSTRTSPGEPGHPTASSVLKTQRSSPRRRLVSCWPPGASTGKSSCCASDTSGPYPAKTSGASADGA